MKNFRLIESLVVLFVLSESAKAARSVNGTELIDSILNNYDKRFRPNFGGDPVDVKVTMYVLSFSALSDNNMDFTLDFYFRTYWNDPRLAFEKTADITALRMGSDLGKLIWLPDLFFANEKSSFMHTTTTKNELVKIDYMGNVTRSIRLSVTASCPMSFANFPMDTQTCSLEIESYMHNSSGIVLAFRDQYGSVSASGDASMVSFLFAKIIETTQDICLTSGNYSRLRVDFEFKRSTGYYLAQVYTPCNMLVIMSYITFWLNRRAHLVRLTLCALSMLLLACGVSLLTSQFPRTHYIKAIDIYTGVSMTFVFYALVAFAYISNFTDNEKDFVPKIDKISRYAIPILFVAFNVLYWTAF